MATLRDVLSSAAVLSVRAAGRWLPLPVLWLLLLPLAALRSIREIGGGGLAAGRFRGLPPTLRGSPGGGIGPGRLLRRRTRLNLAKLLLLWPERLASPRWTRFRCDDERWGPIASGARPVILATLHFGPMGVLLSWLRCRRLPVAIVAERGRGALPWHRRHLIRLRDRAAGLEGIPSLIETGQVWEMHDHLKAGRVLLIAVDAGRGRHVRRPSVGDVELAMNAGFLRLAALTGAVVVPCLIRSGPLFSSTIHLGEPIPERDVADRDREGAACEHLLREFLAVLATAPEECSPELLGRFREVGSGPTDGIARPIRRPKERAGPG